MSGATELKELLRDNEAKFEALENQDIDAYVEQKLAELRPKIKAEAIDAQEYEKKVLQIKAETLKEAIDFLEKREAEEAATVTEEEITEEEKTFYSTM